MTTDYPIPRPPSEQLVDLHVYLLPREVWNEKYSSTYNESISEARSAGFVRVWPDLTVSGLRMVIEEELGNDLIPPNYTFLRSVGRCMTQVKPKQELELKCKAFLPPTAWAPEIVVLESQRDSMSVPMYQSFPGYSPRHDATQPINGIPTHFPQVANHDRMAPPNDGILRHITHSTLVPGDSSTIHPAPIPAPIGQRLPLSSNHHPNPLHPQHPTHTQNANLTNNALDAAQRSDHNHRGAVNPDNNNGSRRIDNPNTSANNSASFNTVQPLPFIAHSRDVLVVKSQSGSHPRQSTHENAKKSHPISSHPADPTNTQSNSDDDTNQVADVASPTNKRTINNSPGENVDHDTAPATTAITGLHHTNNLHRHNNIHQSGSRRLSRNDSSSVPFPAPLSATPPDTPTSDTPPPGQSPMVQQQQGYKGDPLQSMVGIPGKSGRPDAYTNNTNEDSGIAGPTPDDDDPDYERRKSDIDDQYYNQLHPNQTQNEQFKQGERRGDQSDGYQEKEIEEERQRQAEIQQREEERRKEEERIEAERQREEVRREHDRKLEQKRREDAKKQRQREVEKKWEEERRKEEKMKEEMERARKEEAERLLEEERRQSIAEMEERERAAAFDGVMPLDEGDDDYDNVAMETNQALDSQGHFLNDEQLRRRAEDELQDYEPQSTWKQDGEEGGAEMGHLAHPGRKNRSREDTEMEMASQQAVQDGLKRVHLTPEVHRKAKIGKIRNDSVTDEEDIYETDPEMADLLEQLQSAREERIKKEKERENLIKRARDLQTKTYERRNRSLNETKPRSSSKTPDQATHPRDYWKKRFYDEKKKTAPLEEQGNRVRNQLEVMHRKLLSHVEGKKKGVSVKGPPSKKNNHKIAILKMQHELDELKRKVDNSRMKLTSEIKLRNQTEAEVRGLKGEVTQRKINMTLIRNQKLAALKTGDNKLLSKTPVPALGQGPMSMSAKR